MYINQIMDNIFPVTGGMVTLYAKPDSTGVSSAVLAWELPLVAPVTTAFNDRASDQCQDNRKAQCFLSIKSYDTLLGSPLYSFNLIVSLDRYRDLFGFQSIISLPFEGINTFCELLDCSALNPVNHIPWLLYNNSKGVWFAEGVVRRVFTRKYVLPRPLTRFRRTVNTKQLITFDEGYYTVISHSTHKVDDGSILENTLFRITNRKPNIFRCFEATEGFYELNSIFKPEIMDKLHNNILREE